MTPDLPELHEGLLDDATLDRLVEDLQAFATVLDVLVKGAPTTRTDGRPVPLADAIAALRSGAVRGVQIRYRHDGDEWRDTLFRAPGGVKIVRMRMDLP